MKALLELPETWHVVVNNENRELLERWKFGKINTEYLKDGYLVGMYGWRNRNITKKYWYNYDVGFGQEITTADFKRLVLGEKNFEDCCVKGCKELVNWFENNQPNMDGKNHNRVFYFNGNDWRSEYYCRTKKLVLPLSEYLKLLPKETGSTETEVIETEVKIKKTWETIYFETKNASIELTLNHDKKTFNLNTKYEGNVSFKKDTIESAKEKLKCIECALNYVEQNLNKK